MPSILPDPDSTQPGQHDFGRSALRSSDQFLPPVEPPSAGFLLQLFVIPAVIVASVVGLWFVIESLARSGQQDAGAILQGLRSSKGFQQAAELADMLNVPERYPALRTNRELAQGIAELLDEQVDAGDDAEGAINMRYILASLLGELHVDDGLPALVKTARRDENRDVRRRAINAIAVLADSLSREDPATYRASDELVDALVELADDQDELVRSETAFAIGVVAASLDADSRLVEKLQVLADDPYTDARFNAAAALARQGNPLAPASVAEMLDPDAIASSLAGEKLITADQPEIKLRSQQAFKRNMILNSALSAINAVLERNASSESLAPIEVALAKFLAAAPNIQDPSPVPDELVTAMERTLARVKKAREG
jgi:HEAT repeat protein